MKVIQDAKNKTQCNKRKKRGGLYTLLSPTKTVSSNLPVDIRHSLKVPSPEPEMRKSGFCFDTTNPLMNLQLQLIICRNKINSFININFK
jgi:hypothetical protein